MNYKLMPGKMGSGRALIAKIADAACRRLPARSVEIYVGEFEARITLEFYLDKARVVDVGEACCEAIRNGELLSLKENVRHPEWPFTTLYE